MHRPDARAAARLLLLLAFAAGVIGDLVLDGPAPGINVPLMTVLVLALAWLVRRPGRAPDPLDAWLPATAVLLSTGVALRADPFVGALDMLGAAAFTGASMAAFSGLAVTRRSLSTIIAMSAWVVGAAGLGIVELVSAARPIGGLPRVLPGWVGGLARGVVLAIPLVLILAVLFASADPIFQARMDDLLGFRIDLGDVPGRIVVIVALTWLIAGLLAVAAQGIPAVETASLGAAVPRSAVVTGRLLGTMEALVILGAVDLVVGLFVGLQLAYLFGGQDTLSAAGMTYSDYARRGYFELIAASALSGGILVALEYGVTHRTRTYLLLAGALVAFTLVVLASAALRLQLYQDAYGWTELRLYVAVSIVAMAATLATLAAFLATDRTRWLGHAMTVIGVVALIALNLISPPAFVAERNLARVIDPSLVPPDGYASLDADYLGVLPDDAIPAIVDALPRLPAGDAVSIRRLLLERRRELAGDRALSSPFAWNLGRERAKTALATLP